MRIAIRLDALKISLCRTTELSSALKLLTALIQSFSSMGQQR